MEDRKMLKRIDIETKEKGFVTVYRYGNDVNGNPRYLVHYLMIDLPDYISTDKTRQAGLTKYHGRAFGGGYRFTSYNVEETVNKIIDILHKD